LSFNTPKPNCQGPGKQNNTTRTDPPVILPQNPRHAL